MSCSKSSLEAAAEAAARVNAMLIAKGKLKLPPNNSKVNKTGGNLGTGLKTTGDLFTAEVEINDAPLSARNMLTRGVTQDEINKYSGAAVSTRGRYMTFEDRAKNANERPLYLHVQASTRDAVDLAVEKIHKIIEQHLKSTGSTIKWSRAATTIRSGPTSTSPPPLMSLHPDALPPGAYVQEKVFVGLENTPVAFQLKEKIVGPGESYLQHIRSETGASVFLKGKGSGYLEPASGREAFEPLHIHLTHPKQKGLHAAKELAINLIQTVQQEYAQWQQQQTLAVLTIQSQQSALGAQQVALQQSLQQQVGLMTAGTLGIGVTQDSVTALSVAQNHLQASSLQVGGLNAAAVATSIPAFLPTSLSTSLTTSMPSILTTNAGGQLHLVQGQVLSQAGGVPTLVGHAQPLQGAATTANVNILPQASQVVYTPAFQQQVQTSQAMVQATQAILTSQAQMAAATQQQHQFSQVALQTHAQAAVAQQQAGVAPTTFYFVSQAPLPSTGFSIANNQSAAVQLHVEAQAQAQVQALAQAQAQAQAQVQAQQQSQNQARVLQQVSNVPPNGTPMVAAYPFQFPQVTNVTASTHTTPTAITYPHYRTQGDALAGQKRKFQEDSQMRDNYLYGGQPLRTTAQPGLMSISPATSSNYNHPHHHHHAMVSSVAAPGLQANPVAAPVLALPPHLMPTSLVASKPNELTYRDQQLMPPPPVPVSQGGGNISNRNVDLDRKRLKGALWNVASMYGSSDEEDDDNGNSMSPVNRQLQRAAVRRNYPPYGAKPSMYPPQRINDEGIIPTQPPSLQGQVSYSQSSQLRYQYQNPFWMAPN